MVRARALPFPQGAGSQQGEALEDFGSFVLTIWRSSSRSTNLFHGERDEA